MLEFPDGYLWRFGLVHVDDETQKRIIKASGRFLPDVVRANGL